MYIKKERRQEVYRITYYIIATRIIYTCKLSWDHHLLHPTFVTSTLCNRICKIFHFLKKLSSKFFTLKYISFI